MAAEPEAVAGTIGRFRTAAASEAGVEAGGIVEAAAAAEAVVGVAGVAGEAEEVGGSDGADEIPTRLRFQDFLLRGKGCSTAVEHTPKEQNS